jgi:hypothetical protein
MACAPFDEMVLKNSFVQLMEDVGCDSQEDVSMGKIGPEGGVDLPKALQIELDWIIAIFTALQSPSDRRFCSEGRLLIFPTLGPPNGAFWTPILVACCNETLLWIVSNVCSQDGVYPSNFAIGARHQDTILTSGNKWPKKRPHGLMEESILCISTCTFRKASEFCNQKVADQDRAVRRRLAADTFGYVA